MVFVYHATRLRRMNALNGNALNAALFNIDASSANHRSGRRKRSLDSCSEFRIRNKGYGRVTPSKRRPSESEAMNGNNAPQTVTANVRGLIVFCVTDEGAKGTVRQVALSNPQARKVLNFIRYKLHGGQLVLSQDSKEVP